MNYLRNVIYHENYSLILMAKSKISKVLHEFRQIISPHHFISMDMINKIVTLINMHLFFYFFIDKSALKAYIAIDSQYQY